MLTTETIRKLANKLQTTEANIQQEYLQHLFLSYFYQQPLTAIIYFKGGTALHLVHNSPRFSEDLDFNTLEDDIKKIEDCVLDTLQEVEREGISTAVEESKKTTGGYLGIFRFTLNEMAVVIQVEISFRKAHNIGELKTIVNDFIPTYTVFALEQDQLVDEKIQALLTRKKPRDFYDLYFILRANLLPLKKKGILSEVLAILKQTDLNFENELKQFLPKSHWAIMRDFKVVLAREIQRFI